jgi:hypothetical protein
MTTGPGPTGGRGRAAEDVTEYSPGRSAPFMVFAAPVHLG